MFALGNLIVDHIAEAVALNDNKQVLYTITQLNTATVDTTADSTDTVDKYGNLVKRIYRAKSCTFTATNAMLDVNVIAGQSGENAKQIADPSLSGSSFEAPKITITSLVKTYDGDSLTGVTLKDAIDLSDMVQGTLSVTGLDVNNAKVESYPINATSTSAGAKAYGISSANKLIPPTAPSDEVKRIMVVYTRTVTTGLKVVNSATDFAQTVDLILKAMAFDPCEPGTLRALYIEFPSFQPSPQVSFDLAADSTFDYSGDAQVAYCDDEKAMYILTWADEDDIGLNE